MLPVCLYSKKHSTTSQICPPFSSPAFSVASLWCDSERCENWVNVLVYVIKFRQLLMSARRSQLVDGTCCCRVCNTYLIASNTDVSLCGSNYWQHEKLNINNTLRTHQERNKKLSCRRETGRCFASLNISLSHCSSLKVIRNDIIA